MSREVTASLFNVRNTQSSAIVRALAAYTYILTQHAVSK